MIVSFTAHFGTKIVDRFRSVFAILDPCVTRFGACRHSMYECEFTRNTIRILFGSEQRRPFRNSKECAVLLSAYMSMKHWMKRTKREV